MKVEFKDHQTKNPSSLGVDMTTCLAVVFFFGQVFQGGIEVFNSCSEMRKTHHAYSVYVRLVLLLRH